MAKANGEVAGKGKEKEAVVADRQVGGSMMEQLVPEITTHALSYLDYPSLCRLSMTNSSMRRAANDDNAWKALYHKVGSYSFLLHCFVLARKSYIRILVCKYFFNL